jgi:type II restriction/modification system DNA methylase subunit YeeA
MDAVLAFDEQGHPYEPEWPEADVVIGNPPFLGVSRMRTELGDNYVEQLRSVYEGKVPAGAELVAYWFERAREKIAASSLKRSGLIATQSIRMGANRRVLEQIQQTGKIFNAWQDRPWILEGAAVRVSIVSFDNGDEKQLELNGQSVEKIHSDLTSEANLTTAERLVENKGICFMGPSPKAPLDIDDPVAQLMLDAPINVNNRPNSDVIRPVYSGIDIVQKPRNKWTIDFGLLSQEEASQYEIPFEYVKKNIYPIKSQNRRAAYAEKWWQYAEPRPGMRKALEGLPRFIATPSVAKHRVFIWVNPHVLCNQKVLVFARQDDYFFGILHSRIHEVWSLATSSRHGDGDEGGRPTYNNTTCFETFAFPWAPGQEPNDNPKVQAIAEATRELVEKRDNWLNPAGATADELKQRTLTNLYNQRPTWLNNAHKKLDKAVFAVYGWSDNLRDEEILERLLALNLERAAQS